MSIDCGRGRYDEKVEGCQRFDLSPRRKLRRLTSKGVPGEEPDELAVRENDCGSLPARPENKGEGGEKSSVDVASRIERQAVKRRRLTFRTP